MSAVQEFLKFMTINNQGDDYDEDYLDSDYDDDADFAPPSVNVKRSASKSRDEDADYAEEKPKKVPSARPQPFRPAAAPKKGGNMNYNNMEVSICKPASFEDATQIADSLLGERSVVLNLEGMELTLAQRIFDFASGACYALKGRMEAISKYVYVITPESVYISGDTQDEIGVLGKGFGASN